MKKVTILIKCQRDYLSFSKTKSGEEIVGFGMLVCDEDSQIEIIDSTSNKSYTLNDSDLKKMIIHPKKLVLDYLDEYNKNIFKEALDDDIYEDEINEDVNDGEFIDMIDEFHNSLSNCIENTQCKYAKIKDGAKLYCKYTNGYEKSCCFAYDIVLDDEEEFDTKKLSFIESGYYDNCECFNISAFEYATSVFIDNYIIYGNKVFMLSGFTEIDYNKDIIVKGEYYPTDCFNPI